MHIAYIVLQKNSMSYPSPCFQKDGDPISGLQILKLQIYEKKGSKNRCFHAGVPFSETPFS